MKCPSCCKEINTVSYCCVDGKYEYGVVVCLDCYCTIAADLKELEEWRTGKRIFKK